MVFKWRDDHTDTFLDYYKEFDCLWDTSSELYKNKLARENAYINICDCMKLPGLTVADVRNKIKIIRTSYKTELNKIIKSRQYASGLDDVYVPRLFWFKKADSFLRNVSLGKESLSKLATYVNLSEQQDDSIDEEVQEDNSIQNAKQKNQNIVRIENSNYRLTNRSTHGINTRRPLKFTKKRNSNLTIAENSINKLQKIVSKCKEDDEFDYFAKSIAIQLRNMPLDRALICQEKLLTVITEERLSQLKSDKTQQQSYESDSVEENQN